MNNQIQTADNLKAIINYILWSFDVNNDSIAHLNPVVIVQDLSNVWTIKIEYTAEIVRGSVHGDPTILADDKVKRTDSQFTLLKTESFRQLTKYVEDICEEMGKVEIDA